MAGRSRTRNSRCPSSWSRCSSSRSICPLRVPHSLRNTRRRWSAARGRRESPPLRESRPPPGSARQRGHRRYGLLPSLRRRLRFLKLRPHDGLLPPDLPLLVWRVLLLRLPLRPQLLSQQQPLPVPLLALPPPQFALRGSPLSTSLRTFHHR